MSKGNVEAVWCFPPTLSNYRALYGRVSGSRANRYTKDYLQVGAEAGRLLMEVFGIEPVARSHTSVTYAWPGGETPGGMVAYSADRPHFAWPYNGPPEPFGFDDSQGATLKVRLPGLRGQLLFGSGSKVLDGEDAGDAEQRLADEQWQDLRQRGFHPWWVFVRLYDDADRVHVRLYLDDPPPGYAALDIADLPPVILERMRSALPADGYASGKAAKAVGLRFDRDGEALLESRLSRQVWAALQHNRNVLLSGPPGTGKTVALEQVTRFFVTDPKVVHFDPDLLNGGWTEDTADHYRSLTRAVVFHPSYGYEDFVLGVLPEPTRSGVGVRVRPGPLLSLAHFASNENHRALLTLDEFNRGNAAAIFGDTLALLDTDKRHQPSKPGTGALIDRPYPGLDVKVQGTYTTSGGDEPMGATVALPDRLYLLAAMNSSDRSVAPLDAAMRRRFSILFVEPDYEVLAEHLEASDADTTPEGERPAWEIPFEEWEVGTVAALVVDVLRALNYRIGFISGRDFALGQAQFWQVAGENRDEVLQSASEAFDRNVVGTLRLTYLDHDEALAAVLGLPAGETAQTKVAQWLPPPGALAELATSRLVVNSLAEMTPEHQAEALRSLV